MKFGRLLLAWDNSDRAVPVCGAGVVTGPWIAELAGDARHGASSPPPAGAAVGGPDRRSRPIRGAADRIAETRRVLCAAYPHTTSRSIGRYCRCDRPGLARSSRSGEPGRATSTNPVIPDADC